VDLLAAASIIESAARLGERYQNATLTEVAQDNERIERIEHCRRQAESDGVHTEAAGRRHVDQEDSPQRQSEPWNWLSACPRAGRAPRTASRSDGARPDANRRPRCAAAQQLSAGGDDASERSEASSSGTRSR
jgi:hypothetical protein